MSLKFDGCTVPESSSITLTESGRPSSVEDVWYFSIERRTGNEYDKEDVCYRKEKEGTT